MDAVHLAAGHRGLLAARHALNGFLVAFGPFETIIPVRTAMHYVIIMYRCLLYVPIRIICAYGYVFRLKRSHPADLRSDAYYKLQ